MRFIVVLALGVAYVLFFLWYMQSAAPHISPQDHTTFWFGLLHGFFAVPDFVVSWFNSKITIYQSPNDGLWYNCGFLLGIFGFTNLARP